MSVTFYGLTAKGEPIMLDIEDRAHLNLASASAQAFLSCLGIEPGADPAGEVGMSEVRRAIMRARATFERGIGTFTREGTDT